MTRARTYSTSTVQVELQFGHAQRAWDDVTGREDVGDAIEIASIRPRPEGVG